MYIGAAWGVITVREPYVTLQLPECKSVLPLIMHTRTQSFTRADVLGCDCCKRTLEVRKDKHNNTPTLRG